jgi:Immunity protein 53
MAGASSSHLRGRASTLIALDWLQNWYRSQCNGKWERIHGVTIETLDCPGWLVTIDLAGTKLESAAMPKVRVQRSKMDWIDCAVEHGRFYGQGDVNKLECILLAFQHWVTKQDGGHARLV